MIEVPIVIVALWGLCYMSILACFASYKSRTKKEIARLRNQVRQSDTLKLPVKALVPGLTIIDRGIRVSVETHPAYKGGGRAWEFDVAPVEVVAKVYATSYTSGDQLVEVERYE